MLFGDAQIVHDAVRFSCSGARMNLSTESHDRTLRPVAARSAFAGVAASLALAVLGGCLSAPEQPVPGKELYADCWLDSQCESRICLVAGGRYACQEACPEGTCSVSAAKCVDRGAGLPPVCINGCPANHYYPNGYTCVDRQTVSCEDAGSSANCNDCGGCDATNGETCSKSGRCLVPKAAGAPCDSQEECLSGRCGVPSLGSERVCLVAPGATCTDGTCEHCEHHPQATPERAVCAPDCLTNKDCPQTHHCFVATDDTWQMCLQYCGQFRDATCPTGYVCARVTDPDTFDPYFCVPK